MMMHVLIILKTGLKVWRCEGGCGTEKKTVICISHSLQYFMSPKICAYLASQISKLIWDSEVNNARNQNPIPWSAQPAQQKKPGCVTAALRCTVALKME